MTTGFECVDHHVNVLGFEVDWDPDGHVPRFGSDPKSDEGESKERDA
jgi:hypothetical protein